MAGSPATSESAAADAEQSADASKHGARKSGRTNPIGSIKIDRGLFPFEQFSSENTIAAIDIHDFHDFDDNSMAMYQKKMDAYFSYDRPLYPSRDGYSEIRAKHFRYFRIVETDTERTFPDDADFRRCIDAIRHVFARNVVIYTVIKRAALIVALSLIYLFSFQVLPGFSPFASTAVLCIAVLLVFSAFTLAMYNRYEKSLRNSCSNLKSIVNRRYNDLSVLLPSLQRAIESGDKLHISAGNHQWPRKAAFITKLIIWVAKRMEYQEKYLQPEMWRISRMQYFWRNIGKHVCRASIAAFLIAELLAVLTTRSRLAIGPIGGLTMYVASSILQALLASLAGYGCYLISRAERFNLDKEYVQDILRKDVRRISGSRIDEIIGELVENDKTYAIAMFHRDHPIPRDTSRDAG